MRYSEVPMRAIEVEPEKTGPDIEVQVLGKCDIYGAPALEGEYEEVMVDHEDQHPKQLEAP